MFTVVRIIANNAIGLVWQGRCGVLLSGPHPTIGWYEIGTVLDGEKYILLLYADEFTYV